jgi:AraC-like DNA-binding protein
MDHLYPVAVVFNELLCGTPSVLGRLEKLSGCYDHTASRYRSSVLEPLLGADGTHSACSIAHRLVWNNWLRSSLQQQLADILVHFRSSPFPEAAPVWTTVDLGGLQPLDAPEEEQKLAAANFGTNVSLLVRQSQLASNAAECSAPSPDSCLAHVLALIHQKYTDPLFSLAALSTIAGISERQIARLLRSHIDCTFTEYVRRLRVQTAQQLLLSPRATVRSICAKVGYTDPRWFTQHFRSLTGFTPLQYRKRTLTSAVLSAPAMSDFA